MTCTSGLAALALCRYCDASVGRWQLRTTLGSTATHHSTWRPGALVDGTAVGSVARAVEWHCQNGDWQPPQKARPPAGDRSCLRTAHSACHSPSSLGASPPTVSRCATRDEAVPPLDDQTRALAAMSSASFCDMGFPALLHGHPPEHYLLSQAIAGQWSQVVPLVSSEITED